MTFNVSYIIVTWNNADIIGECIDSLFHYSPVHNEVIVVDNASTDGTCEFIRERYKSRVRLIEAGANLGFSKANNLGLTYAEGDYIFFVNPDVIFIEDIITPMIRVLTENKDIGIVSPCLVYKNLSYQISTCNFPSAGKVFWDEAHFYKLLSKSKKMIKAQAHYTGTEDRYVDWTYGAAHLCRAEEVKKVGGYPQYYFMYGEDTEFCMLFLKQLRKRTYYLGSSKLIHLGGYSEKQVVNSKKIIYGTKAAMFFVNKYYGKMALLRYRIILFAVAFIKYTVFSIKYFFSKNQRDNNGKAKQKACFKTVLRYDKKPN